MTKKIGLLVLFLGCLSVQAQQRAAYGGIGYGDIGMHSVPNALNTILEAQGLLSGGSFPGLSPGFGGGGFGIINNFIIGGQGFGSFLNNRVYNSTELDYGLGGGLFTLGYTFVNRNGNFFYPTLGIGGAGLELEIENNGTSALTFGNESILPDQRRTFEAGTGLAEIALNFQRMILDPEGGIAVGFRIGYRQSLIPAQWYVYGAFDDEDSLGDIENLNISQFFFSITIGGGGFSME